MKQILTIMTIFCIIASSNASAQIGLLKKAKENSQKLIGGAIDGVVNGEGGLSENEVTEGLTTALHNGAEYAVKKASAVNGFNNNDIIRIPFPPEARKIETTLSKMGFEDQIKSFETKMNEAAEVASKEALNILGLAIKNMNIKDAYSILKGDDNAATTYLRRETNDYLYESFKPIVITSMQQFNVAKKWNGLVTKYNAIPLTQKINPDLEDYITNKAIDGLFVLIAEQEKEIRLNPYARTSEILTKVFGD
ncbi:MAG: DUF4197 domain-containing protein [Flavobacteriales bacterium]|nr:DUF4197 domain-containing protein [Flavobacteriales bacterium]